MTVQADVNKCCHKPAKIAVVGSGMVGSSLAYSLMVERGVALNLSAATSSAVSCARREDDLIFHGSKKLGLEGLLTAQGVQSGKLKSWNTVGAAAEDLMEAVTTLDASGSHGPYALALAADRYNLLFRRYPQGGTEIKHLRTLITEGIIKAPALSAGGVLVATGRQFASIVLGQDLMTGYVGPAGSNFGFLISESVALRLLRPDAVCVLKAGG